MLKIFIAGDSIAIRGKLKEAVEEQGFIKVIGESGDARQAIAEIHRLDLRCDYYGHSGAMMWMFASSQRSEITHFISHRYYPYSFPFSQYRETYLATGADCFFDKTKDIPLLITTLAEIASKIKESSAR